MQRAGFRRHDDAAAAAEHADVLATALAKHVHHVFEVLDVTALVGADGDGVGVLLQRCRHHFLDGTVVAQVNDLRAVALEDAAHDVDGGVVAVEQAGRGDEAQPVFHRRNLPGADFGGSSGRCHRNSSLGICGERCC